MNNYEQAEIINNQDITPKKDIVFKKIFGAKGNEGILKDFLESILDIKIDSLVLDVGTELLPEFYKGKKSMVDVRTTLSDGTEVNIEIQVDVSKYSDKRCLQHWSKIYSNTLQEGRKYEDLRKTICIWILNGEIYNEFEDFHSKWEIMNKKHIEVEHFKELEIHMIELKKFRRIDIMKPCKKDFWLWFIDHTNEELIKMAYDNNDNIKEAREQLDRIRADKELMERIRLQEAYEMDERTSLANAEKRGVQKGIQEGIKKGTEQTQREIVLKLLKMDMPIEQIEEITGLSREEIEKIKIDLEK